MVKRAHKQQNCVNGFRKKQIVKWWARKDSNLQPMDYESIALTVVLRAHALETERKCVLDLL